MDLSDVTEGDLVNEFYKALTPKQWYKYHTKMNKIMDTTYGGLNRTDVIDGKIVCTEIRNHKEQVVNVLKINKNVSEGIYYFIKEANKSGYNEQQVQDAFNKMYGEENVSRYDISSNKFISIPELEQNTGKITDFSRQLNGETIQGRDKQNNSKRQELDDSSFSLNKNAKRYDDLIETNYIEYFRKDNGDVKVYLMDSNNNIVNDLTLWSNTNAIKELGENLGNKIYETATNANQRIEISNDINNIGKDTDYFMNHRPSEGYGNASNFEENMPDVFEHPEWYLNLDEKYNRESLNALKKVRKNPEAELTIYRATIGNKINAGDWVTPSKSYAEYHNNSQFNGEGNILEMKVKAKDIQFAGDDINEFGYFPTNETKHSLSQKGSVNNLSNSDITSDDVKIVPINKELKALRKEVKELKTLLPKVNKDVLAFSQQVDDVIKGTFPKENMLTLSKTTPKIFQDIGLNNHPITMTQRHLKTVMNATGKYKGANYHDLGVDTIKKIPEALNNPLNVLKSSTDDNSIVVVTDLADKNERPIIASIKIDGTGTVDNIKIMSKDNYDNFMQKNISLKHLEKKA